MLKDIDSAARAEFLKLFFWMFYPFGTLGLFVGEMIGPFGFFINGILGVLAGGILGVVLTFAWMTLVDNAGGVGAGMLSGRILKGGSLSLREQLEPEMQKVKYLKGQKQFTQALETVNGILEKDLTHTEALYLKAGILLDGFGDATAAKGCLRQIMDMEPVENEMIRRWAAGLYDELRESEVRR